MRELVQKWNKKWGLGPLLSFQLWRRIVFWTKAVLSPCLSQNTNWLDNCKEHCFFWLAWRRNAGPAATGQTVQRLKFCAIGVESHANGLWAPEGQGEGEVTFCCSVSNPASPSKQKKIDDFVPVRISYFHSAENSDRDPEIVLISFEHKPFIFLVEAS